MITLAIDTSGETCATALHDSERQLVLAQTVERLGRGHAERLMDMVGATLAAASVDYARIGRVVSTAGPGSFTGIRVGLATARGIALGLGLRALGLSSLLALALHCRHEGSWDGSTGLLVLNDARRGEAYGLWVGNERPRQLPDGHFVARYEDIARHIDLRSLLLCGSGAARMDELIRGDARIINREEAAPIASIAACGSLLDPEKHFPEPIYVRAPDARPQAAMLQRRMGG